MEEKTIDVDFGVCLQHILFVLTYTPYAKDTVRAAIEEYDWVVDIWNYSRGRG